MAEQQAASLHGRAADGDGDAFAALSEAAHTAAKSGTELRVTAYARAVIFGRLAMIKLNRREDWIRFILLLEEQAAALRIDRLARLADLAQGEAIALAECMADDGDEEAAQLIAAAGAGLSENALIVARDLRKLVEEYR